MHRDRKQRSNLFRPGSRHGSEQPPDAYDGLVASARVREDRRVRKGRARRNRSTTGLVRFIGRQAAGGFAHKRAVAQKR
jgi:hypothetical protein